VAPPQVPRWYVLEERSFALKQVAMEPLAHVEALEANIDVLSERIAKLVEPWTGQLMILNSITGVGPRAAEVILAEIGPDMSQSRPPGTWRSGRVSARASARPPPSPGGRGPGLGVDPPKKIIELGPPATS
jgi:transposase